MQRAPRVPQAFGRSPRVTSKVLLAYARARRRLATSHPGGAGARSGRRRRCSSIACSVDRRSSRRRVRMPARAAPSPGVTTDDVRAALPVVSLLRPDEVGRDGLGLHAHVRDLRAFARRGVGRARARPTRSRSRSRCCSPTPGSAIAVLIPITCPLTSTSGPPEFPGLIAASVWMASTSVSVPMIAHRAAETGDDAGRHGRAPRDPERVADRDDRVADLRASRSRRAATVGSPSIDLDDREVLRAVFADHPAAVRSRRRSTSRRASRPPTSVSAFATCALVTIIPSDATMKPVPVPDWLSIASGFAVTSMRTTAGSTLARIERMSPGLAERGRRPTRPVPESPGSSTTWSWSHGRRPPRPHRPRSHRRRARR